MTAAVEGVKRKDGRWIAESVITEPLTFHDQRAKSASDEEEFEEAHDRLAHDNPRTTQKIYRRKPLRARAGRKVGTSTPANIPHSRFYSTLTGNRKGSKLLKRW